MNFRIFGILVVISLDESLSSVLEGNKSSNIWSNCSEKVQVNMVPSAGPTVVKANITATFGVGLAKDNSITGRIEWIANDDTAPMVVKLLSFVDDHVKDEDYYLLNVDDEETEYNVNKGRKYAHLNCIHIPPSVNTTIKAVVYKLNSTSCDCDFINMGTSTCLSLCQMDFISSYNFQASKDACVLYRRSNQDYLTMNLMGEMISDKVTRFKGYFSNVNPFSSARVSIFPDDELHYPHIPILTFLARIDESGGLYFSVDTENKGYFEFYAKLQLTCSNEHISVDYISDSVKIKPYDQGNYTGGVYIYGYKDAVEDNSGKLDKEKNTEVLYGIMIGIIVLACIITVTVWVQVRRRNKRRSELCSRQDADIDLHSQLCSPTIVHTGKASEMNNSSNMMTKTKAVMMLAHPDTIKHENDVEDLVKCLQMYDICVHDRPEVQFQNWRDFAEKAGEEYKDVVIVLSRGLIELCDIYKSKGRTTSVKIENDTEINLDFNKKNEYKQTYDERWYELLEQRNGEYIPCVALDKIRTVVQDRISEVQIHFVTFCDTTEHFTFNDCEENKPNSISNMSFKHFVDLCPYFKQSQTGHHLKQEQRRSRKQQHLNHHENNGLIHAVKNHACSKSQMTGELESFLKSCDQNYVWEFIKRNTFLQTENTLFHTISRNVLKYLLLSETDNDIDANLLSLISVFKD